MFIPPPNHGGGRSDFFTDGTFLAGLAGLAGLARMGMGMGVGMRGDALGGLADMFGQMPGGGIGTGPGVIQEEHYSPTLGRHRSNGLFNGHGPYINPPTHTLGAFINPNTHNQLDRGGKAFNKPNQAQRVSLVCVCVLVHVCYCPVCLCGLINVCVFSPRARCSTARPSRMACLRI